MEEDYGTLVVDWPDYICEESNPSIVLPASTPARAKSPGDRPCSAIRVLPAMSRLSRSCGGSRYVHSGAGTVINVIVALG